MRMVAAGALVLAAGLAACGAGGGGGASSSPAPEPIEGSWQLDDGQLDGGAVELVDDHPVTLTIEDGAISGRSACNAYGGRLAAEGGRIRITDLGMTDMACGAPAMTVEAWYHAALGRVGTIAREGDRLVLAGEAVVLRFHALAPPPTAELVDTVWVLETVFVGDIASAAMGERATLELRSDGTFIGSTGCRGFEGSWIEEGEQIVAPTMAMTEINCELALADQDGHVTSVIGDGFVATIDGPLLTLVDPGSIGLTYRAAEPGAESSPEL